VRALTNGGICLDVDRFRQLTHHLRYRLNLVSHSLQSKQNVGQGIGRIRRIMQKDNVSVLNLRKNPLRQDHAMRFQPRVRWRNL